MSTKDDKLTEFESSRLARVGRIVITCAAAWGGFGIYYLLSGRVLAGCQCVFQVLLSVAFAALARSKPELRETISKLYPGVIVIGLTADSFLLGLDDSISAMFFSCAVIVAILTMGRQNVGKWICGLVVLIFLIHFVFPEVFPDRPGATHLDHTLGYITLLGVVASCCLIAESTAEAYARRLEATTAESQERAAALDKIVGIDALTSLRNRRRFREDATRLLESQDEESALALLLIDLDCFKQINDRFGHAKGDDVLREFAQCLQEAIGGEADVYRLGGDEFVAIVSVANRNDPTLSARQATDRIRAIVDGGLVTQSLPSRLGVSIGVALSPSHATTVDDLLLCADKAMYAAKGGEDSIAFFEPKMAEEAARIRTLHDSLDVAIRNQDFTLHYQPLVAIESNRIVGFEALIRWERDGEIVSPIEFIPPLESSGKIVVVGAWVMREACRQLSRWRDLGFDLRMSVNVSSLQIQQPSFSGRVLEVLAEYQLPTGALDLEVTESILLEQVGHAHGNIERLTQQGVGFSIDDFGTGYSSLAYLKQLTFDRLKIDRSFIKDIPKTDDGMIAETVITLAKHLGMIVVAEGVETESQLEFLRARGCEEFQGYFFSAPLPAEQCQELLEQSGKLAIHREVVSPMSLSHEG